MAILGKRSLQNLNGVHPKLVLLMKTAILNTPIDFTIVEGVRTSQRQQELYAQGRTTSGPIVTYADGFKNRSNHQPKKDGYGYAVDIYAYYSGKVQLKDLESLRTIINHVKTVANEMGINIVCGIDWKKPFDPPHVQLV